MSICKPISHFGRKYDLVLFTILLELLDNYNIPKKVFLITLVYVCLEILEFYITGLRDYL